MQFQKRNPVTVLLLSIVTCGIYELYLIYAISKEIRDFRGDNSITPGLELLLSIITCGLYEIYWFYKYGRYVIDMEQHVGINVSGEMPVILLLLPIFGMSMIGMMILQTELNQVWDTIQSGRGPDNPA